MADYRDGFDMSAEDDVRPAITDPHKAIEIIRECDETIARVSREKAKHIQIYQDLMKSFEEHYHGVMVQPDSVPVMAYETNPIESVRRY